MVFQFGVRALAKPAAMQLGHTLIYGGSDLFSTRSELCQPIGKGRESIQIDRIAADSNRWPLPIQGLESLHRGAFMVKHQVQRLHQ